MVFLSTSIDNYIYQLQEVRVHPSYALTRRYWQWSPYFDDSSPANVFFIVDVSLTHIDIANIYKFLLDVVCTNPRWRALTEMDRHCQGLPGIAITTARHYHTPLRHELLSSSCVNARLVYDFGWRGIRLSWQSLAVPGNLRQAASETDLDGRWRDKMKGYRWQG